MNDLIVSVFIVGVLALFLFFTFTRYSSVINQRIEFSELEMTAIQVMDALLETPGIPTDWEKLNDSESDTQTIGLADYDRRFSKEKIRAFLDFDNDSFKEKFKIREYDYYFGLKKLNLNLSTTKFGEHTWTDFTNPSPADDSGYRVAVDSKNNIYVVGTCSGCGALGWRAIYTMKFDSNGNHLWTNITDPTASDDTGVGIATDSDDNVYVLGTCDGCGNKGAMAFYTMKFDSNGKWQWTNITDPSPSSDFAGGIDVDSQDNVYITGNCEGCNGLTESGILVIKSDADGHHQWTYTADPGTDWYDKTSDIATDKDGNVYVIGICYNCGGAKGGTAFFTMALDSNGNLKWQDVTDPSEYDDYGYGITTDSQNNVYVTGSCDACWSVDPNYIGNAIYTMKFDSNGNKLWTYIDYPEPCSAYGADVAADNKDNPYITGRINGDCLPDIDSAIYTIMLDSGGVRKWSEITNPGPGVTDSGGGVAIDSQDDLIVTGACNSCGGGSSGTIYTMKINTYLDYVLQEYRESVMVDDFSDESGGIVPRPLEKMGCRPSQKAKNIAAVRRKAIYGNTTVVAELMLWPLDVSIC